MRRSKPLVEINLAITGIEAIGTLIIAGYALLAISTLLRAGGMRLARLQVAEGAITGLTFKLAATLLKTIILHTWQQILLFSAILALRIILKQIFNREFTAGRV